ncbi:MAG TPA: nicotinamidase, partial [Thermoanaerobaculia bacterium]
EAALFVAASEWRKSHAIRPAGDDARRVHLFLVDLQRDFCFREGTLYVGGRSGRGALDDSDRIARFVYRNLHRLTTITCTLDTHYPHQIFSPAFWLDADGAPPSPHREVTADDVRSGRLRPNAALAPWLAAGDADWLTRQAALYCEELERAGKYRLYLWPPHCLLGSEGHAFAGVIQEARLFHAYARTAPAAIEVKGGNPLTENYSALAPEVLRGLDGRPLGERNVRLIETLLAADALLVAGQAASHCVRSTLDDLLDEIERRDPRLAAKVYVLEDAMSAVAVPDPARPGELLFDFTEAAQEALARYARAGMHVVRTTEPVDSWPGFSS